MIVPWAKKQCTINYPIYILSNFSLLLILFSTYIKIPSVFSILDLILYTSILFIPEKRGTP